MKISTKILILYSIDNNIYQKPVIHQNNFLQSLKSFLQSLNIQQEKKDLRQYFHFTNILECRFGHDFEIFSMCPCSFRLKEQDN